MRFALLQAYYESAEYREKLYARAMRIKEMEESDERREYWMDHFKNGGIQGEIDWIETFAWVKIPEFGNAIKPFFLFPYQIKTITKIFQGEMDNLDHEFVVDKPRGMGMSWLFIWHMMHHFLFVDLWSGFVLSRTETEVDDGTSMPDNSLFGKVRWGLKKLPKWMIPAGFVFKDKKGTNTDMTLRLINPATQGSINGSSTNSNAGRSRRYSFIFVDEAFFIENFSTVYAALQSVSRMKIFVSTVKTSNKLKKFVDLAASRDEHIALTWRDHPFKDDQWHQEQLAKAEFDEEVMKEVEPSYAVPRSQQYYPEMETARQEPLQYDPRLPVFLSLDFGSQDRTIVIYYQWNGKDVLVLEAYKNSRRPLEWYMPFLGWWCFFPEEGSTEPRAIKDDTQYNEFQQKLILKIKEWRKPIGFFGEVAHFQKVMPRNTSIAQDLARSPYRIRLLVNTMAMKYKPRRLAAQRVIPRAIFNSNSPHVQELFDALTASRYASPTRAMKKTAFEEPLHDGEIGDYRAAFENFCVNFGRVARGIIRRDQEAGKNPFLVAMVKFLNQ